MKLRFVSFNKISNLFFSASSRTNNGQAALGRLSSDNFSINCFSLDMNTRAGSPVFSPAKERCNSGVVSPSSSPCKRKIEFAQSTKNGVERKFSVSVAFFSILAPRISNIASERACQVNELGCMDWEISPAIARRTSFSLLSIIVKKVRISASLKS